MTHGIFDPGRQLRRKGRLDSLHGGLGTAENTEFLGVDFGETTADGTVTLERVYCLGNCACAPSVRVGDAVHARVTPERLDDLDVVILGDLSIQGNIKSLRSLVEPLQVGMDNGARKALVPLENKRNFLEVSGDIVERVDPVFYSDPMTAAMKALGMN